MFTRLVGHVLIALSLFLPIQFAHSVNRAAPQNTHNRYHYSYASAEFSSTDPSGCITTQGSLSASAEENTSEENPGAYYNAYLYISQINMCTGSQFSVWGYNNALDPDDLRIDQHLNRAELKTIIWMTDYSTGATYPAEVQLAWTGTGAFLHMVDKSHYKYLYRYSSTYRLINRAAQAVGSVRIAGQEFTPTSGHLEASDSAWIVRESSTEDIQDRFISTPLSPWSRELLAAPGGIHHVVINSGYAYAQSGSNTPSQGCILNNAWVHADEEKNGQAAKPEHFLYISVNVYQYDQCLRRLVFNARAYWVPITRDELVFSNHYRRASLDTTVQVVDYVSDASFPVEIHLTWEASGPMYNNSLHSYVKAGDYTYLNHMRNPFWDARVSGTITAQGVEFLEPTSTAGVGRMDQTLWEHVP